MVAREGLGGAAVLTDCVPSKTLISTSDYLSRFEMGADPEAGTPARSPGTGLQPT